MARTLTAMPILHTSQSQPRRRPAWRRRVDGAARALSAGLRAAWRQAFPVDGPEPPHPPGPVAPAAALRDGARLSDRLGAPIGTQRAA